MDFATHNVKFGAGQAPETAAAHKRPYHLVRSAGRVVPHETLLANVWRMEVDKSGALRHDHRRPRRQIELEYPRHVFSERVWAINFALPRPARHGVVMTTMQRLTVPELAPPPGYAHVAVATGARLVMTAGAVPLDAEGRLIGEGDVRAQAQQTIDNLMRQLAAGGASGADVLKTTVYVASTDHADLNAVWRVVQASPLAAAASTLLGVALLGFTGQLVEIEAVAALP